MKIEIWCGWNSASAKVINIVGILVVLLIASTPMQAGAEAAKGGAPCKYKENCECAAPGITLRWKADYCMRLQGTDDFESEGVQQCLWKRDPGQIRKAAPCKQNEHWKKIICQLAHKNDKEQMRACLRDKNMVPRFVEEGAGG